MPLTREILANCHFLNLQRKCANTTSIKNFTVNYLVREKKKMAI